MKKIAVLGSGRGDILTALFNYFKNKDIEIKCFSDNLNSDILIEAEKLGIESKYLPYEETVQFFNAVNFDLIVLAEYDRELTVELISSGKFINIHPSLLPAFKGKDAISRAFSAGVKVSGVTVQLLSTDADGGRILAQYPVLIGTLTHFDEFQKQIYELENVLYPIVIDKVLKDEVFDFTDLIEQNNCSGSCSGCSDCH